MVSAEQVWAYMPANLKQPPGVLDDYKTGVTPATFKRLVQTTETRLRAKLRLEAGYTLLPSPDAPLDSTPAYVVALTAYQATLPEGTLQAGAQVTAAYILRGFQAFQVLSKELFADGYATLDAVMASYRADFGKTSSPAFVEGTIPEGQSPFGTLW